MEVTSQQVQTRSSNSVSGGYRNSQRGRGHGNYFGRRGRASDVFYQFAPPGRFNRFPQSNPANASNTGHDEN